MTQTLASRRPAVPGRPGRPGKSVAAIGGVAPLWLRSLIAAAWAIAVGLAVLVVISLVVWSADSRTSSSAGAAMRFAVSVWLAGQRVPLHVPGGSIGIAPLGLTILLAMLLARFARVLSRDASSQELGAVAAMVIAVSLPYAGLAAGLAFIARTDAVRPAPGEAFLATAIFSVVATTAGGLRGAGQWRALWERLPEAIRAGVKAAGMAAAALVAVSTALTIGAVVRHWSLVHDSLLGYGNGSGQFTIGLLSLWLVPNAALFTAAYLSGTGFAVGAGSSVSLAATHIGATPALPLLAAVPHGAAPPPVIAVAIAGLGSAAAFAAWVVRRHSADVALQLRAALVLALAMAVGMTALAALAGGPAGPSRLAAFGPSPWRVGLFTATEVAGPVVLFVAFQAWWRMWRSLPGR